MFKIAVIGRGLFGSAAARHLAEMSEGIAVIGPDEPRARAEHSGVFASHYDEGRMTRLVDPMPELAATAGAAIARYRDIEARSGISFYTPSGYLGLGHPGSSYNALCAANGGRIGADIEELDTAALRARYPFLAVDDGADGLVERGAAGHISPRRLVRAQTVLAESAGAEVIRQPARDIRAVKGGVEITLWDGTLVAAEKVLVTTGAFTGTLTGHAGLSAAALGLTVFGRTTVLVRTEGDVFEALKDMPTMVDCATMGYLLPPIRYPDGHSYLKLGVGTPYDPRCDTLASLQAWFKGPGAASDRDAFTARLKTLFPVLAGCEHWHTDTCAVTKTASGLPIIDFAGDDRVAVAVGGNGKGAKGSDEWGRIAADLVAGRAWSSPVAREKLAFPGARATAPAVAAQ